MQAIEERGAGLATPGWEPRPTHAQEAEAERFLAELRAGRYSPPTERVPPDELLAYLAARGLIENTGRGVVFDRDVYVEMVGKVTEHLRSQEQITIAEVRDMFGTSRKYAQALLEHLDATKVTRRAGDAHVLRSEPEEDR
jgi:selenocysteine-specific elongation factor